MDTLKKISIKTNSIKRYIKDTNYYLKELAQLQAKHQLLLDNPQTCPHDLKKLQEVIDETSAMIPDCQNRLNAARIDLQEFITNHNNEEAISSSDIFREAQVILSES